MDVGVELRALGVGVSTYLLSTLAAVLLIGPADGGWGLTWFAVSTFSWAIGVVAAAAYPFLAEAVRTESRSQGR